MKKLKTLSFIPIMLITVLALAACSNDDNGGTEPGPTLPPTGEDIVEIASDGEQKAVTVPIAEPWEATSSADWLQLSQMGGKGGESVQVIAAKNLTGRERIGYIRFGEAPGTRASAETLRR